MGSPPLDAARRTRRIRRIRRIRRAWRAWALVAAASALLAGCSDAAGGEGGPPDGPPGRIVLAIVDAATGERVPAMVSPLRDGAERATAPEDALDPTPLWPLLADAEERWTARWRGRRAWIADGTATVAAAPGRWSVHVRRGLEHVPRTLTLDVPPGATVERTVALERWTDLAALGWISGDDHVHARVTSDADAELVLRWARAEGVQVANVLSMGDAGRTYFHQRGYGREFRVREGDTVLVPGQEDPRTTVLGHALGLGPNRSRVRDVSRYLLYGDAFDRLRAQGALAGYAHVRASRTGNVQRGLSLDVPRGNVDFAEVEPAAEYDLYYRFLDLGLRLAALAGSDVPWGETLGQDRAYVYAGERFTADGWLAAAAAGRTFVTDGPLVLLDVDGALPGDELRVARGQRVRVRARALGHPALGAPVRLEVVRFGEVVRAADGPGSEGEHGSRELALDFELEVEGGGWVAARVEGTDGTHAHTTPVWLVREGLRPWNHAAVPAAVAELSGWLDELAAVHAGRRAGTPATPSDAALVREQWEPLEARIREVRGLYARWLERHASEAVRRELEQR